jgi:hypothetical protein
METKVDICLPKVYKFECIFCKKIYKERSGLWRHKKVCKEYNALSTKINNSSTKINNLSTTSNNLGNDIFECKYCEKPYTTRQGLWKHRKICKETNEIVIDKDMLMMIMKEQTEVNKNVLKVLENGTHNMNNSNNTNNSHNKTFNLQIFLNETCKNAMNISDFLNSIELNLSDLEDVGELGYVDGISNIIINNLKKLDVTERPIHCTDVKRETLYIKDKDKWEKENEGNEKMMSFVRDVANKNIVLLTDFKKKYPDCCKYESAHSDHYNKLVLESMGGTVDNKVNHKKIIKNVSKMVTIDKDLKR